MSVVDVQEAISRAHREEWAGVVAALARRFGDLDIAEEAAAGAAARDECPRIVLISMADWQLAEDLVADASTKAWMAWRKVSQLAEGATSAILPRGLFCSSSSSIGS